MGYLTFENLTFEPHSFMPGSHARLFFPNGYGISVVLGEDFYSNGKDTYEVAVLIGNSKHSRIDYETPITDDVIGNCTKDQVTEIMKKIQDLNGHN